MTITVTSIGSNVVPSSSNVTVTPSVSINSGNCIVVAVMEQGAAALGTGVTDDAGNPYTLIQSVTIPSGAGMFGVYYCANCLTLSSSQKIRYTPNNSGDSQAISACYATEIATSSALDASVTASNTGTSGTPVGLSGTPSQSGELIFGIVGQDCGSGITFTQDSTDAAYQNFPVAVGNTGDLAGVGGGCFVQNSTTALKYAPTINSGDNWAVVMFGLLPGIITPPGASYITMIGQDTNQGIVIIG